MAKLVDAPDLGSGAFGMGVRVSSRPNKKRIGFYYSYPLFILFVKETRTHQTKFGFSSSGFFAEAEVFCLKAVKPLKTKCEMPFNAKNSR